jgi:iron complex outermembrane receptor protein
VLSCLALPAPSARADDAPADVAAATAVAPVTVNAEKRPEDAQSAPLSVTAVSAGGLGLIRSESQINVNVPNLAITALTGGGDPPEFVLRGVSVSDFSLNQQSPIAMFVDEVYKSVVPVQSLQVFDLDHLEVLRGPQTTLYGKNAEGGAVSFFTRSPTFGPANGYVTLGYGSYNEFLANGAYGAQLIDGVLAGRIAFSYDRFDSFVRGLPPGLTRLAGTEDWAVRGSLRWRPSPGLEATFRIGDGRAFNGYDPIPQGIGQIGPGGISFVTDYTRAGLTFDESQSNRQSYEVDATRYASLNITAELPKGLNLTSVASYDWGDFEYAEDGDGAPFDTFQDGSTTWAKVWAEDLRLSTGHQGPLQAVMGVYLSSERLWYYQWYKFQYSFAGLAPGGVPDCLVDPILGCNSYSIIDQFKVNRSVYADATYALTSRLRLTAGARYSNDEGRATVVRSEAGYYDPTTNQEFFNVYPTTVTPGSTYGSSRA